MTCEEARKNLPLVLYGELSFDEEELVESHMDECSGCRIALAREMAMFAALDGAEMVPAPQLLEESRTELRHRLSATGHVARAVPGAVAAAAILHDPHAARGDLIVDAMIEQDHAVGDVFLETETRERVLAPFAGDNRGDAERFQELKQPPNLSTQKCRVRKS